VLIVMEIMMMMKMKMKIVLTMLMMIQMNNNNRCRYLDNLIIVSKWCCNLSPLRFDIQVVDCVLGKLSHLNKHIMAYLYQFSELDHEN
jgi:hypothetical protein